MARRSRRPRSADVHPRALRGGEGQDRPLRRENIAPGDILLTNDPDVMGSHLNHMIFTLPIFNDGEPSPSPPRWRTGSTSAGSSAGDPRPVLRGIQIPFVKIFKEGVQDDELTALIRMNCRCPSSRWATCAPRSPRSATGERRMTELLAATATRPSAPGPRSSSPTRRSASRRRDDPRRGLRAESFMETTGSTSGVASSSAWR